MDNFYDKNIKVFQLPFLAKSNEDYERNLKKRLEDFIKEINKPVFKKEENLFDDIKIICQKVLDAFTSAKLGKSKEAEEILAEIIKDYKKYPFAVSELDKSYAFRGIAPFDELREKYVDTKFYENMLIGELNFFRARVVKPEEAIHTLDEINYLPYSKNFLSNDMRFSSEGKVCLYLGTTSYVCSEECRWNRKDNLYLSSFKFNEKGKKLKILNLAISQAVLNGMMDETNLNNALIRVFPLIMATMVTVKTPDEDRRNKYNETIKYEYLLSQVLMNTIQKAGIDGVAYLSCQGENDFIFPHMVCLAIPISNTNNENEYGDLVNCYEMTEPVLFSGFSGDVNYEKKSYINEKYPVCRKYVANGVENCNAKIDYEGKEVFYQETPFSRMDDYLVNLEHVKFVCHNKA